MKPLLKAQVFLFFGLVTFTFAPILVRLASPTDPVFLTLIRTLSSVLMLSPFYFFQKKNAKPEVAEINKWHVFAGIALGFHFIFWIASLSFTSVASASVLVTSHPILLIVTETLVFKTQFTRKVWIGVFMAFAGAVGLGIFDQAETQYFDNPSVGNAMAFIAACFFVFYAIAGKKARVTASWLPYVFKVYAYVALVNLVVFLIYYSIVDVEFGSIKMALIVGISLAVGPQITGHGAINYALKHISPTLISTLILVEPVFATILAFFFFSEMPNTNSLFSMALIMLGIAVTWQGSRKS